MAAHLRALHKTYPIEQAWWVWLKLSQWRANKLKN